MRRPRTPAILVAIAIAIALITPLLAFGFVARETVLGALTKRDTEDRLRSTSIAARVVDETLRAAGSDLQLIAARIAFRDALARQEAPLLARHVRDLKAASSRYDRAAAFNSSGIMIASDPADSLVGGSFANSESFIGSLTSAGVHVSASFQQGDDARGVVEMSLGVTEGNRTLGMLQVTLSGEDILTLLKALSAVEGREIVILDARSRPVATTLLWSVLPFVSALPRSPASGSVSVVFGGSDRIASYVPIPGAAWTLYTLDDRAVALAVERDLEVVMSVGFVVIAGLILVVAVTVGWLYSQRLQAAEATSQALEAQRQVNAQLTELDQRKDDFVSIVSHEFRTPLTGILGFSEMIRDEGLSVEEMKEFAGDINKDARRLGRMINEMLDLDRLQSGGMELTLTTVDLNEIVRDVTDLVRPNAPGHSLELALDVGMPAIEGDLDRITQVVTNLLNNAVKYSPAGGRVVVRTAFDDGQAGLTVTDSGIGMPEDSLEHIFEKFTRVESREMRDIQGTGLGLPIVRQIVEMHGGRVWAESELGKGSTFHVTLPSVVSTEPITLSAPA